MVNQEKIYKKIKIGNLNKMHFYCILDVSFFREGKYDKSGNFNR